MNTRMMTLLVLLMVGLLLTACGGSPAATFEPTLPPVASDAATSAEGKIVPVQSVNLSFGVGGQVAEVLVREGDAVEAGAVIAHLKDDALQAAVMQAEAGVAVAKAGQARYLDTLPQQIAAAEAEIKAAQAQIAAASARRDNAAALIDAESGLAQARYAQQQAQTAYDRIIDAGLGGTIEEQARLALQSAIMSTQAAQARVDALTSGSPGDRADTAQVVAAVASQTAAQVRLDQLRAEAEGKVDSTYAATIQQAEAALQAAKVALSDAELRAPFAGTIARLSLKAGENTGPSVVAAVLADFSVWHIETDDLTEIDVPNVRVGQSVTVKVDALPDVTLKGEVESVGALSQERSGDVVYPVKILLLDSSPALRWGMTVAVTFEK